MLRDFAPTLRSFAALLAALILLAVLMAPGGAHAAGLVCPEPFRVYLNGATLALPAPDIKRPLVILAIGSSSTEGVGASSPDHAYPAQLAAELGQVERAPVNVINAGVGGETADATLGRLETALDHTRPSLVIWQVGTNDALRGADETRFRGLVDEGVAAARARGAPIVLMDPQFALGRGADPRIERFDAAVDDEAARLHAPLLERYAAMKALAARDTKQLVSLLAADGLHMNDLGYACLAHALAGSIAAAIAAPRSAEAHIGTAPTKAF